LRTRSTWLKGAAKPNDVVMTEVPEIDFLYGGSKTVPYPESFASADELEIYLTHHDVRYIVVAPQLQWLSVHTAVYSPATIAVLDALKTLAAENKWTEAHSVKEDSVVIFARVDGNR